MKTIEEAMRYEIMLTVTDLLSATTTLDDKEKLKVLRAAELLASFARDESTDC